MGAQSGRNRAVAIIIQEACPIMQPWQARQGCSSSSADDPLDQSMHADLKEGSKDGRTNGPRAF